MNNTLCRVPTPPYDNDNNIDNNNDDYEDEENKNYRHKSIAQV